MTETDRSRELPSLSHHDWRAFWLMLFGTAMLAVIAIVGSRLAGFDIPLHLEDSFADVMAGIVATIPLLFGLFWFSKTKIGALVRFRESQIEFFGQFEFDFTPLRILIIAIAAGICEELLFRGFLQSFVALNAPLVIAVIAPNILFGALHARTMLYALIAGGVGIYMGVLFAVTGNLIAPIITHALYDWIALDMLRRMLANRASNSA